MQFKKLRLNQNGEIINLDGYYLEGEIGDYTFRVEQNDGSVVQKDNPNRFSIYDKNKFANVISKKLDTRYWVSKEPLNEIHKTHYHFSANEVIEFEFYD